MNRFVSVAEAKKSLSALLREAWQGTTIIITRHGKPLATLRRWGEPENIPAERLKEHQQALSRISALREQLGHRGARGMASRLLTEMKKELLRRGTSR